LGKNGPNPLSQPSSSARVLYRMLKLGTVIALHL
jgi:hypothetical protein